jgi:NADPH:quinone reductase-like Zn-dependent oxidoreductase
MPGWNILIILAELFPGSTTEAKLQANRAMPKQRRNNLTHKAMWLDGKRAVVIGGATGVGFGIAELASELGATIVIASSDEVKVNAAVERLHNATGRTVDVRDGSGALTQR